MASPPPSASNSDNSATHTPSLKGVATDNAGPDITETKVALHDLLKDMNSKESTEKFRNYEADYTRRLKAKYFSDKDIYGGNIFEEKLTMEGLTIKASRWPCTKSYEDPASFADQSSSGSTSVETPFNTSNGKNSRKSN